MGVIWIRYPSTPLTYLMFHDQSTGCIRFTSLLPMRLIPNNMPYAILQTLTLPLDGLVVISIRWVSRIVKVVAAVEEVWVFWSSWWGMHVCVITKFAFVLFSGKGLSIIPSTRIMVVISKFTLTHMMPLHSVIEIWFHVVILLVIMAEVAGVLDLITRHSTSGVVQASTSISRSLS